MELSIAMEVPQNDKMDGLFHRKSIEDGWLGGTPISGNLHSSLQGGPPTHKFV